MRIGYRGRRWVFVVYLRRCSSLELWTPWFGFGLGLEIWAERRRQLTHRNAC